MSFASFKDRLDDMRMKKKTRFREDELNELRNNFKKSAIRAQVGKEDAKGNYVTKTVLVMERE